MYKKVENKLGGRTFVVGDLHGCYDLFIKELDSVAFNKNKDIVVSVGDLIDRGKQNLECLSLLKEPWFFAVRGNHEQMALDSIQYNNEDMIYNWCANGGFWFFDATDKERELVLEIMKEYVDKLPYVIEVTVDDIVTVVCHADYPCNEYSYGNNVNKQAVIWNRERFYAVAEDHTDILGADRFIFGHTPTKELVVIKNQAYIDTGAVFTGNLVLVEI